MRGIAIACVAAIGCANNVPQDRMTGPDGRLKGAKPIKLENGEAKDAGIVTYPGGDRVDWKVLELPAGKKGRLDFAMKWTTPRPGLQLNFDVFDEWQNPVANAKGNKGRLRDTFINDAKGKYFVRVYAKGRGDAGAYRLAVAFTEQEVPKPLPTIEIPDPPRLPDVPGAPCATFDARDPECKKVCPPDPRDAPRDWLACGLAPTPPVTPPPVTPVTPPPAPPANPIKARIIKADVQGGDTVIIIPYGKDHGVTTSWTGTVMRGDSAAPMVGGTFTLYRVDGQRSFAKVRLTTDVVNSNPIVIIKP
jgi:hypothetical protein